jgi:hypothetical protein
VRRRAAQNAFSPIFRVSSDGGATAASVLRFVPRLGMTVWVLVNGFSAACRSRQLKYV